jgi:hypothetical protein
MKTKILSLLAAGCLLIAATWLVNARDAVQADPVPEKYRATVQKGLDYLAGKQFKDGHWEGDGGAHPVAMTGLVGLAFLMVNENPEGRFIGTPTRKAKSDDKHLAIIRKAVDWLIEQSQTKRDGLIFSEHPSETSRYMHGHGLATIFLAGAYDNETDDARRKKLREVLVRAVKYIVGAQSTQGGWHDTSRVEGHDFANVTATAIQLQALQAVENIDPVPSGENIRVPSGAFNDGMQYLKTSLEKGIEPAEAAAALACVARRDVYGAKTKLPQKWLDDCRSRIPAGRDLKFGRDELAHCYLAQAEHYLGGDAWNGYRTAMFDRLRDAQNKDGSWPDGVGTFSGPVFSAAVWCTVLQLDHDSHPSRQRQLAVIE